MKFSIFLDLIHSLYTLHTMYCTISKKSTITKVYYFRSHSNGESIDIAGIFCEWGLLIYIAINITGNLKNITEKK